ncbi:hypothetical protein PR003_g8726 [Phytophthora rubi]|uniref:Uncharacterized protein n=1 Tax=Phytophthora rubi TaxID=129364 RepID=A0A6A3N1Q3_9STRA|nr:hypothetical protein PR002_g7870 [Phytophthora rubi]KAE9046015.1 hypothetical protein PR001_g4742 [Phytophthora rubi]KAE9343922.1 hypothetical protein PR003_g8726 [Phytophthora rubi]
MVGSSRYESDIMSDMSQETQSPESKSESQPFAFALPGPRRQVAS